MQVPALKEKTCFGLKASQAGVNSKNSRKGLNGAAIAYHRRKPIREIRVKRAKPEPDNNSNVAQFNRRFDRDPRQCSSN